MGILLLAAVAHVTACSGRSKTTSERGDGGEPSSGGRGGAGATATGGNEPATGGVAGTDAAGSGGTSAGRGGSSAGRGGSSAGQSTTGGSGGGRDDCNCDESFEEFSCTVSVEEFCYGPSAFGCPPTLDKARMNLGAVCDLDGELGRYFECGDDMIEVSWLEGGENIYQLYFDRATGKLVGGLASGYIGGKGCLGTVRAGIGPGACGLGCRFCREPELDRGGEGGGSGLPLCEFPPGPLG